MRTALSLLLLACLSVPSFAQEERGELAFDFETPKRAKISSAWKNTIKKWVNAEADRVAEADMVDGYPTEGISLDGWDTFVGDIDGDGDKDAVVAYHLGWGGSGLTQYVATFINTKGKLRYASKMEFGGSGQRMATAFSFGEEGMIAVSATIWTEEDGQCCPTQKGLVYLKHDEQGNLAEYVYRTALPMRPTQPWE